MVARACLLAVAVLALNAPSAVAATVQVSSGTLSYNAAPGEANSAGLSYDAEQNTYEVYDPNEAAAGPGCKQFGNTVRCDGASVTAAALDTGDGDDTFSVQDGLPVPFTLHGGRGKDNLTGPATGQVYGDDGDDRLAAPDNGGAVYYGGAGNDDLFGHGGNDTLDGGDGDDFIISGGGADSITGGLGLDKIELSSDDQATIDCQGRDDDVVNDLSRKPKRVNCATPTFKLAATRVSVKKLVTTGMPFTVTCHRPCAIEWDLRPSKKLLKFLHHGGGFLQRRLPQVDRAGYPRLGEGTQRTRAGVIGSATRKALGRLRSFSVTLSVQVFSASGLSTKQLKKLKVG
jgi:hypothetical protein